MKELKNKDFCEGCSFFERLETFGQHAKCNKYNKVMTPTYDMAVINKGFNFPRLEICKKESQDDTERRELLRGEEREGKEYGEIQEQESSGDKAQADRIL